jgi:hypothetical protein
MKSLKQLAVTAFIGTLVCSGLYAQNTSMLATIPFDFHAGKTVMPAGEYRIEGKGSFVILRGAEGGMPIVSLLTNGAVGPESGRKGSLVFHRYGDAYFLTKIWNSYSRTGRELLPTAAEKEVARRWNAPAQTGVVIASSN